MTVRLCVDVLELTFYPLDERGEVGALNGLLEEGRKHQVRIVDLETKFRGNAEREASQRMLRFTFLEQVMDVGRGSDAWHEALLDAVDEYLWTSFEAHIRQFTPRSKLCKPNLSVLCIMRCMK